MSLLHSLTELTGDHNKLGSNLELIDKSLSGELTGKLADLILNSYTICSRRSSQLSDLVSSVRRSKEAAISSIDSLLTTACNELRENKMNCYVAETQDEARKIVGEIVGSGKLVFKSFSLTLEECGLGEHLVALGNDVHDTEFPMLANELTGGVDLRKYREMVERADFGITDAVSLSANSGALFLLPKSGFERLISMAPPRHVALVGIDQLVASYEEGFSVVELAIKLNRSISYAGVVGGPSKTGDIEKKIVYGAHGPREVHVILFDDGRREAAARSPLREALSLPSLGKIPCRHLWPFWRAILGMEGYRELSSLMLSAGETEHLGIDLRDLLRLL